MSADIENVMKNVCRQESPSSVTLEYWQLQDDYFVHGKVVAIFISLYILVGLPWNILVVIAIIREKLYKEPTVILLLNLLTTDILSLLVSIMFVVTGFAGEYLFGSSDKIRCETCHIFIIIALLYCSMLTLAVMSVDRVLYIHMPFRYDFLVTPHTTILTVIVVQIISISIGFLLRFYPGEVIFFRSLLTCSPHFDDPEFLFIVLFMTGSLALFVILAFNIWLAYIATRNVRKVYTEETARDGTRSVLCCSALCTISTRSQKQNRVFGVVCGLTLPCLISWMPLIISLLLYNIISEMPDYPVEISTMIILLFYSQAVVHPIVETVLIPEVRKSLRETVTCGKRMMMENVINIIQIRMK